MQSTYTYLKTSETSWRYNQFDVDLVRFKVINTHIDQLFYRKTDTFNPNQRPVDSPIINLRGKTILQKIESYKKCQVIIDNGGIRFFNSIKDWDLEKSNLNKFSLLHGKLSLLYGKNSMQWHLAFFDKRINQTMPFSEAIVLSKRCSTHVRNIFEKMNAIDGGYEKKIILRELLLKEFVVHRVMNKESIELELAENAKNRDLNIKNCTLYDAVGVVGVGLAIPTAFHFGTTAVIGVISVLGGGLPVMALAGYAGLLAGGATLAVAGTPSDIANEWHRECLKENNKKVEAAEREKAPKLEHDKFIVEFEPISASSRIDSRANVSKFMWAVTIVTGPQGTSKSHAAIIIEGLTNDMFMETIDDTRQSGEYFMLRAELNPPIVINYFPEEEYKRDLKNGMERTEIWMKPSDKVLEMLKSAIDEKIENRKRSKNGEALKFNSWGKNSVLGDKKRNLNGHSCFTWSREKVSLLDIHLGKGWFEQILVFPRNFTKSFSFYEKKPFCIEI
ncbi:MAG: hypothetical protein H0T62_12430 [Parachlamydiaceae bacterium]|nr:hypothetical protein [Parachlamydiaceae bacterium]